MDLLFTKAGDWISHLIRFIDNNAPASHVGILEENRVVVSAEGRGVIEQPLDKFLKGRKIVAVFQSTHYGDYVLDLAHAREHIGEKYDYLGLFGFLFLKLGRWFRLKLKNVLASRKGVWCSELVLHLDHRHRVPEFRGLDVEGTTPGELLKNLEKGGPTFIKISG